MRTGPALALAAGLGVGAAPMLNAIVDPLEALRPPAVSHSPYGADRVAKIDHVLEAPPYEGLVLGSSRTALLDPLWRDDMAGRWYNLGLLGATPAEIADIATALARRGRLPAQLVLGLDVFGFAPGAAAAATPHPVVAGRSAAAWTYDQLFAPSAGALLDVAARAAIGQDAVRHDYAGGGALALLGDAAPAKAAPDARRPGGVAVDGAQLDAVRRLAALAEGAGARLCLVWHPHSPAVLGAYRSRDLARLQAAVARIGPPVVDLMRAPWSQDPAAWFDAKHLAPAAARQELDAIAASCPTAAEAGTMIRAAGAPP